MSYTSPAALPHSAAAPPPPAAAASMRKPATIASAACPCRAAQNSMPGRTKGAIDTRRVLSQCAACNGNERLKEVAGKRSNIIESFAFGRNFIMFEELE